MCIRPWTHKYVDLYGNHRLIDLPCGHCIECVQSKQNSYKIRLIEHSKDYAHCYFFTLTYRNSALPYNVVSDFDKVIGVVRGYRKHEISDTFRCLSSARVRDIQDWFKRFRTSYARAAGAKLGLTAKECTTTFFSELRPDFSYFLCAEYGPNGSHRPHYHGIIFSDLPRESFVKLFDDWRKRYGFVKWKEIKQRPDGVNKASAPGNYVAKYCCKGEFASRVEDISLGLVEPAFILQSKGIGVGYIERKREFHLPKNINGKPFNSLNHEHINYIVNHLYYNDGPYRYKLPRYFYSKIFLTKSPCLVEVYDETKRKYVVRKTFQFKQNPLSDKISRNLRNRAEERSAKSLTMLLLQVKNKSDTQAMVIINRIAENRLMARKNVKTRKLAEFYYNNQLKFIKL